MRFALRSTGKRKNIVGEVNSEGLVAYEAKPFYYDTLRGVIAAANRRHAYMDGKTMPRRHWFALTIVQEQFPRPEPVFVAVTDSTDGC